MPASVSLHFILTATATVVMLAIATVTDLRSREIPNPLVAAGTLAGLILWTVFAGTSGLVNAAIGFGVGLGVFLFMAVLGAMEMGDVKLMGALGALLGWPWVLPALVHVVIAGFFFAIFWVIRQGQLSRTFKNLWIALRTWLTPGKKRVTLDELPTTPLPYGVAIALGGVWTLAAILFPRLNLLSNLFVP